MGRSRAVRYMLSVVGLALALGFLDQSLHRAAADDDAPPCAEHPHLRWLAVAEQGPAPAGGPLAEAWAAWTGTALRWQVEADERPRYEPEARPRVWRLPPQAGLRAGACLAWGRWLDAPLSESERRDLPMLALGLGDELKVTHPLPPNAGPPTVAVVAGGEPEALLVFLRGTIWRGGAYLHVLRWQPSRGELSQVYAVAGEEWTTADLSYSLQGGPEPQLVIHGLAERTRQVSALPRPEGRVLGLALPGRPALSAGAPAGPSRRGAR